MAPTPTPKPVRLSVFAAAVLLAGCASGPRIAPEVAQAEIAEARSAVSQAEQADAATHAPVALRTARQKVEAATRALAAGQNVEADRLAEQAAIDARLAESRARAVVAEAAVTEVREAIQALREEIERNRAR